MEGFQVIVLALALSFIVVGGDGGDGDGRGKSVNADASRKKRMWRECIFDFPRKYSYRMQCLMQGSSYAFPARGKLKWLCAYSPEPA